MGLKDVVILRHNRYFAGYTTCVVFVLTLIASFSTVIYQAGFEKSSAFYYHFSMLLTVALLLSMHFRWKSISMLQELERI